MPLHLITGPANAGKAKLILDAVRARAPEDPILVVPTVFDVAEYRSELAATGAVFGPEVLRFERLIDVLAAAAGERTPMVGEAASALLLERAVERAQLGTLAVASRSAGFAPAVGRLVKELGLALVTPEEFGAAIDEWSTGARSRRGYARDLAALYASWQHLLDEIGLADEPRRLSRALTTLLAEPGRWGARPVFVYGFDDLTTGQIAAIKTLAATAADVTVALTWEPRRALASRELAVRELAPHAQSTREVARGERYSTPALTHLERNLFEEPTERVDPAGSVELLRAAGERAELELIAVEVLDRIHAGVAPEEIAVVYRRPQRVAALFAQVFSAYGIPYAVDQRVALGHTTLGRGLLALMRCALLGGSATDLFVWLRTPGCVQDARALDTLEAGLRRRSVTTAARARGEWEAEHHALEALDRVGAAWAQGAAALLGTLEQELEALFVAGHRHRGTPLDDREVIDAQVRKRAGEAIAELLSLLDRAPGIAGTPRSLHDLLAGIELRLGSSTAAPGVRLIAPLALRARRVDTLIVGGLEEREFPLLGTPEPFLSDRLRGELFDLTGMPLRQREDIAADERALFHACVSRPSQRLVLSYRTSDEDGQPIVRSLLIDEVEELFTELPKRERAAGAVLWRGNPPTPRERTRAQAALARLEPQEVAPLRTPAVLTDLAERGSWSAGQLETWAACPVRWLVESYGSPEGLEPEPEARARGTIAHDLLADIFERLRERMGSARVTRAVLPVARELLGAELRRRGDALLPGLRPARRRAAIHRLEADLLRYLERLADLDIELEPTHFELRFGDREGDSLPSQDLGDGLRLNGRVDRIDVDAQGRALVIDYKGSVVPTLKKWEPENRLQVALYMLAVARALELDVIGGLYQPLGKNLQARGAVLCGSPADVEVSRNDRCSPEALAEHLEIARACAVRSVAEIRAGEIESRPATCHWRESGRCSYPAICRTVGT